IQGLLVGAAFVAVAAALYGATALNSGEFNYQGGDRKACYHSFPFDGSKPDPWTDNARCPAMATNDSDADNVFNDFTHRLTTNLKYFFAGRHFGFVPYFFPGAIAFLLWFLSSERTVPWKILTALAVAGAALLLLILAPFTWSGGGGPPGNRYFMSLYAPIFFL